MKQETIVRETCERMYSRYYKLYTNLQVGKDIDVRRVVLSMGFEAVTVDDGSPAGVEINGITLRLTAYMSDRAPDLSVYGGRSDSAARKPSRCYGRDMFSAETL